MLHVLARLYVNVRSNKRSAINNNYAAFTLELFVMLRLLLLTIAWPRSVVGCVWTIAFESDPDYGIGITGKCLGPTTSKGPMADDCKIF